MAGSTLDPDNFPSNQRPRATPPGHDTGALGPSDLSDTGSDMAGPGLLDDDALGLERGTNEDSEGGHRNRADAGQSVGDAHMDSDTDSVGTGEHLTAGKDPDIEAGGDIGTDRIVDASEAGLGGGLDQAEEAQLGKTDEEIQAEVKRALGRRGKPKD